MLLIYAYKAAGEYATRLGLDDLQQAVKQKKKLGEGIEKKRRRGETSDCRCDAMHCAKRIHMQIRDDDHGDHPFCG